MKREKFLTDRKMMLHPYLTVLQPEDYVSVLMREVRKLGMGSEMYSLPYQYLCRQIGIQVFRIYEVGE